MVKLSASKIKTAKECSWRYWSNYHLKIPDTGNDGSRRGSLCHGVLEHLARPKHREKYNRIIEKDSVWEDPVVSRYIEIYAKKLGIFDPDNLFLVNAFILVGLNYDFWGSENGMPDIDDVEHAFDIHVKEGGKDYRMRGFIDRIFVYTADKIIKIRDYKTSKAKFSKKDLIDNLQVIMYQLAAKKLYPDFQIKSLDFLFLKIKNKPLQQGDILSDEFLEGFEYYLTNVSKYLENFNEETARQNFAFNNYELKWLCGKEGLKPSGEPHWICPYRKPVNYWAKINRETNEIVQTSFKINDLEDEEGFDIKEIDYEGCPRFYKKSTRTTTPLRFHKTVAVT